MTELRSIIAAEKDANSRVESFLTLVRKYTDVTELNAEVIREFVDRIYVHQAESIDGRRVQRIRIVWNCIGEFALPMPEQKEKTA